MGALRLADRRARKQANRLAFSAGLGFGSAVACLLAYFGDPRLGRRRRALAGAKLAHAGRSGRRGVGKAGRTVANHTRGLWARIRANLATNSASDEVLQERVRRGACAACARCTIAWNATFGPTSRACRARARARRSRRASAAVPS